MQQGRFSEMLSGLATVCVCVCVCRILDWMEISHTVSTLLYTNSFYTHRYSSFFKGAVVGYDQNVSFSLLKKTNTTCPHLLLLSHRPGRVVPSRSCWDISLKTLKYEPHGGTKGQSQGSISIHHHKNMNICIEFCLSSTDLFRYFTGEETILTC